MAKKVLFLLLFLIFSLPTQAGEHEWLVDDFVYVNVMCDEAQILNRTGSLYEIASEETTAQADKIWLDALNRAICIYSDRPFLAKLLEKINTFQNLYGVKNYTGELWHAETQTPEGSSIKIYIGIMSKQYAPTPKTGFLGEPAPIPVPNS